VNQLEARHVRVRREYEHGVPAVPGDAEQLYQAFLNLVTNAIDAMAEGGTLTVRVTWAEDDRLVAEVADTGVGIRPEEASSVFNPFFTT